MIINVSEFLCSLLITLWTSTKQLKTKTKSKLAKKKSDCLNITDDFFFHSKGEKTASLKNICTVDVFRITFNNFFFFF